MILSIFQSPSSVPPLDFDSPPFSSQWSSTPPEPLLATPSSGQVAIYHDDVLATPQQVHQFELNLFANSLPFDVHTPLVVHTKADVRAEQGLATHCDESTLQVPFKLVYTRLFGSLKVWIDIEDHSRRRQEVKQLLTMHGATLVAKPAAADLFVLDFTKGTPPNLLLVPSPVLHTCCRSFEWVYESVRAGKVATLRPPSHAVGATELQSMLQEYESARPRRISSMVPRRSRYIDARVSEESELSTEDNPFCVKEETRTPRVKIETSLLGVWRSTALTKTLKLSRRASGCTKEEQTARKRRRPLSTYFVKITRSESPYNVPIPSPCKLGHWSRGAYDLATAGWHLAFYAKWSVEGIVGLMAKKYPHRSEDGWLRILDGKTHAAVMHYHDAYLAKWEHQARLTRKAGIGKSTPEGKTLEQNIMRIIERLRKQRVSERGMVSFLARNDLHSTINWRRFTCRQGLTLRLMWLYASLERFLIARGYTLIASGTTASTARDWNVKRYANVVFTLQPQGFAG